MPVPIVLALAVLATPAAPGDPPACVAGPPGTDYTKPYQTNPVACMPRTRGLPEDQALPVEVLGREQLEQREAPEVKRLLEMLKEAKKADLKAPSSATPAAPSQR